MGLYSPERPRAIYILLIKEDKIVIKKRAFISFDYDNDADIKVMFIGQAKNEDSPFEITDLSIKEAITDSWKVKARDRMKRCDVVVVLCGTSTNTAAGVSAELKIAQEEKIPYFLLSGRNDKNCVAPKAALATDKIYTWTWENLRLLFNGNR